MLGNLQNRATQYKGYTVTPYTQRDEHLDKSDYNIEPSSGESDTCSNRTLNGQVPQQ